MEKLEPSASGNPPLSVGGGNGRAAPTISPWPDVDHLSLAELYAELAEAEEGLRWLHELGSDMDPLVEADFVTRRRLILAELRRRAGPNGGSQFVSSPIGNKPCAINFPLQTWAGFLSTDFAELPFTIEGLAPDSGLIAFHGRGKDGKTTFLIHACRSIATGQPFLNKATVQKPVVYLNYEMGFSYLQKLLGAGGACPDEAYILNRPEPVLQTATIETLMQGLSKPGVMVIDSFRGAFRLDGDKENSSGGAGLILRNLQDLAVKYKWLVVVIHHRNRSAKDGTDAISGTSDWIAAPDVIWTWSRADKSKPGTLFVEGRMPPVDPLAVQLSPEECVFMGSVEESREESDKAAILAALTEEGQAAGDIAQAIERPASSVRKRLESLFTAGLVNREGEGKRGSPFLYSKINCAQNIPLGEETNSTGPNGHYAEKVFDTFGGGRIV